ncbi:MAG TPA: GTP-binding protein, partial [Micromonosporaceae bacterium]
RDDDLLAAYLDDEQEISAGHLRSTLAVQTRQCQVHPAFFGSAMTGEGVDALSAGLVDLLPAEPGDVDAPVTGRVFKIDRGPGGERIAYVRMFAGTVRVRQRLRLYGGGRASVEAKATVITVAERGRWIRRPALRAGEIGRLWGLDQVRVGDLLSEPAAGSTAGDGAAPDASAASWHFAPPTMETVVAPVRGSDDGALRTALAQLAEQDPLINVRADATGREVSVTLYGEVQKEVIQSTLATEFGIDVTFHDSTTICVERPVQVGEAVEVLNTESNPFQATIGLRVEPGPPDSGVVFRLAVPPQTMPLYVYKNAAGFADAIGRYVRRALSEGRFGWQVTDCVVTLCQSGYSLADGPPSKRGPLSTPGDFRNLTPMVLMDALERAGTAVCEPTLNVSLEIPMWAINAVSTALGRLGAAIRRQSVRGDLTMIDAIMPAAMVRRLYRQLPGLTAGEGVLESTFDGYRPVRGEPPTRVRTTADPRHRDEYLISLTRQGARD